MNVEMFQFENGEFRIFLDGPEEAVKFAERIKGVAKQAFILSERNPELVNKNYAERCMNVAAYVMAKAKTAESGPVSIAFDPEAFGIFVDVLTFGLMTSNQFYETDAPLNLARELGRDLTDMMQFAIVQNETLDKYLYSKDQEQKDASMELLLDIRGHQQEIIQKYLKDEEKES